MILLFYYPEKEVPRRKGNRSFDTVTLNPGRNKLTEQDFETLSNHPDYEGFVEAEVIRVESDKLPDKPEQANISTLKDKDAIALVESETNPENLRTWQQQESAGKKREAVLNAIALQLKAVEEGKL